MPFSHLNRRGEANMVDISDKTPTTRSASAEAKLTFPEASFKQLQDEAIPKGDLYAIARVAGIQAAKQCANLIPLCHSLSLSKVSVEFELHTEKQQLQIITHCKLRGTTGVEMEALTAASVAALTVYDMCKALDKGIVIGPVQLLEKTGGKSGEWVKPS